MDDYSLYISDSLNGTIAGIRGIYPEIGLVVSFLLVIFSELFFVKRIKQLPFWITLISLAVVFTLTIKQFAIGDSLTLYSGMIVLQPASVYFKLLFLLSAILFIVFVRNNQQMQQHKKGTGDLYAVLIAVLLGMNCMAMSANLLMVYLSIETVSIGSYIMVGYISGDGKQAEASIKYALFGAACSAIMLYGISLIYSFTGTLNLNADLLEGLNAIPVWSAGLAITLFLVGLGFKMSFVPLHFWSPDVYEGAPTPVTAFLTTGSKIAGFALLWRVLEAFNSSGNAISVYDFQGLIGIVAIVTMLFGNLAAIWQDNIKRMLAYSSIGHTGFLMMALVANTAGFKSLIFYLFIYLLTNVAAFMLVDKVEQESGSVNISTYLGLGKSMPLTFISLLIVLISLTGLPPTSGFVAKFLVFGSALESYKSSGSSLILWMMITGAVTTVVSLFYYFKVPLYAYLRKTESILPREKFDVKLVISLVLTFLVLIFGIFPQVITDLIN
ncbi:NADH-quinone oxidoreductase subunit NuoN [Pedobacter sp. HMF7647]|uniref:NADH-quinone oxidoreductase subunit N n=1 Tax=Hufsiella arboris TaxID=2695275 RepID=A0A7K1Y9Z6_9SPHI|nr:NADH-quinone oxidoreductase subunit N [Hufsiella arboris]MXV51405.1 NADH-quinone oxidoreductase subunit NuoN [Hufsiella arboris]